MRDYFELAGCLLTLLLSTTAIAQTGTPASGPGSVIETSIEPGAAPGPGPLSSAIYVKFVALHVENFTNDTAKVYWQAGSTRFSRKVEGFIASATQSDNSIILIVYNDPNAIVYNVDKRTGTDLTAPKVLPNYSLFGGLQTYRGVAAVTAPKRPASDAAATASNVLHPDEVSATTSVVAILVVAINSTFSDYRSGVYMYDPATGLLVPGFGSGGYAYADGNFQGRWIAATADGVVIGGVSKLDPAHPGIGVANFDSQGKPGTCGSAVKEVLPRTNQFVLPDTSGAYFDPVSGLVTFVGAASSSFFGRQLKPDCTLNTTTFTYPKINVFVGDVAPVTASTIAVVLNEVGNGTSAARVALYPTVGGGAPLAVSPIITSANQVAEIASGPATRAAQAGAVVVSNTNASSIAVQADATILIAGTSDALGGSFFAARYVGVETTTNVVEFYNSTLGHYFITADPAEAAAIDGGSAGPGWTRAGQTWKSGGPARVCRFYGVQAAGGPNGHFYTIDSAECAAVQLDPGWHFESYDFSGWPLASGGGCPTGTKPIKRAYNGRFAQHDSNHRYASTDTIYNQMIAQGWSGEGVVFCAVQ